MAMICPKRSEVPHRKDLPAEDDWRADGTCSFCGSMNPEEFLTVCDAGGEIIPTDKNYKAYARRPDKLDGTFYYQHLSRSQMNRFIELYNSGKMKVGFPGHFYRMPFFMKVKA